MYIQSNLPLTRNQVIILLTSIVLLIVLLHHFRRYSRGRVNIKDGSIEIRDLNWNVKGIHRLK